MIVGGIDASHGDIDAGSSWVVVVVASSVVDVVGAVVLGTDVVDVVAGNVPEDVGADSGPVELWQPVAATSIASATAEPR
jgi:hypothetical protein